MARNEPNDVVVLTVSASAPVVTGECIISGVALAGAATTCAVSLYDPPSGTSTTTGATLRIVMTGSANDTPVWHCDGGGRFLNGCVAVVEGTGALVTIAFAKI